MAKICSIHLQAVYNAGGVRQVDRNPGQAPHGPVYQGELNDGGGPEHKPPRVVLPWWRSLEDPLDGAENSPGTYCT